MYLVTFTEEILNGKVHFCAVSEVHLGPSQAPMMECFCENS